jgi:precorrin-2/cobalt-factor-2 C20-methyltransferase
LEKLVDRDLLHSVAGISAFQAAANKFLMPLTLQEDRFTLMGGSDVDEIEKAIDNCETMAIYKVGRTLGEIKNMLSGKGLVENSKLACYIEQEGREEVFDSLAEVDEDSKGYMSTILLRSKNRKWEEGENK